MPIRSFASVPADVREWGKFFRETTVTADVVAGGTVDTPMLVDGAVTNAKLRDSAGLSVIGRPVSSIGDPSDIAAANDAEVLRRNGATVGFGKVASGGIVDDAVTDALLRNSASLSVIGRSTNSTGDPADIAAANDAEVLRRSGMTLEFGTVATGGIADDAVTNPKLANMAADTIKGRANGAGTGDPTDLTAVQVATIISSAVASTLNILQGTYTPTLTNTTNITASTAEACQYVRIGSHVLVSGRVNIDPTAAGATRLDISIPVASNIGDERELAGVGFCAAIAGQGAALRGSAASDRAIMEWVAVDVTAQDWTFIFSYQVI